MAKTNKNSLGVNTRLAHSGNNPHDYFGFVNPPVVHASTVLFKNAATMWGRDQKYTYGTKATPTTDALAAAEPGGGPRAIGVRFETSGAFMAMAYARVTNHLAACFGCPGPGIANLAPGVLEAFSGCTPMLVLGVRASRQTNGRGAFQETDHLGLLAPITKCGAEEP